VKFIRAAGPLQVIATYTTSKAEDMANYELPEDSRNLQAEHGRASADVPYAIATGFGWNAPGTSLLTRGWSVAGIGTFRGNRPYTVYWGDGRNGTTQNDARPGDRNTGKTDAYRALDLAVTRRFVWREAAIDLRMQAFNALNRANYNQYVGELISPLFGRPVSAFPPRRIELATIIRF
jgi:hypothetical protein